MSRFFSVATKAIENGRHKMKSDVTTLYRGNLVMLSSGEVILSTGVAIGMCNEYPAPYNEYPASDNVAALAKRADGSTYHYINFATGEFYAFVGKDLFAGGALPALGDTLYDAGDGTITKTQSGSLKTIGSVEAVDVEIVNGIATPEKVALCHFIFPAK